MNACEILETELLGDAQLVELCRQGDRDAFGQIVARYQSLICALAYCACGDFARSEDHAQEVFLTAWRQLGTLEEPSKLKSWLCGIARHLLNSSFRQQIRNPLAGAEPLEEGIAADPAVSTPSDQVISQEEEAILWRVLEGLPRSYREPLVLFYRQNQSVAEVAEGLGVSEDVVRQRLSRGRSLLNERVTKFVETMLHKSGPTKAFRLGVLAALPVMTSSASAATLAATAAKGSAAAKAAGSAAVFSALLGPVLAVLGTYLGYKLNLETARSAQERVFIIKFYRILAVSIAAFGLALVSLMIWGLRAAQSQPLLFAELTIGLSLSYAAVVVAVALWARRWSQRLRQQFGTGTGVPEGEANRTRGVMAFEYRSRWSLFGLPLVHIRFGHTPGAQIKPVKAWIAAGDWAIGGLFAFGGLAVAPISTGGFSVGLLTLGGFAVGLLPFGGFSFGPWAIGGQAIGLLAFGGCAMGWSAAQGGIAIARDFALGGVAVARHANDAAAATFFQNSAFFQSALAAMDYVAWLNLLWLLPLVMLWQRRRTVRR